MLKYNLNKHKKELIADYGLDRENIWYAQRKRTEAYLPDRRPDRGIGA